MTPCFPGTSIKVPVATSKNAGLMSAADKAALTTLSLTQAYDPANVATLSQITTTAAVAGAALGDFVLASFDLDLQAMQMTAYVSSANTVTVVIRNNSLADINLAAGNLRIRVFKQ